MGTAQSVYMANSSQKKIWVLIALKPEWLLLDVFVDVALICLAAYEFKAAFEVADLPEELLTIADLIKFMKFALKLLSASITSGTRPADVVLSMLDAFKTVSSPIEAGDAPDVSDESFLNYLNADGIGSLFGANTMNVLVMSDDGHQFAWFGSGEDDSWIATNHEQIVRSRYGSLWQEDPGAGCVDWPAPAPPPPPPPPPPHSCNCGSRCPWSRGFSSCLCNKGDCFCL